MKQNPASWPAWRLPIARGTKFLLFLALLVSYATSCTEGPGTGPVGPGGRSVRIGLRPEYHYSGMEFNAPNRIRWTVLRAGTQDTLQTGTQTVDPADSTWSLQVEFNLPAGVTSANIVVLLELLAGDQVEWSGKTAPIAVTPASTAQQTQTIPMYQGPPANLEISGVDITSAPTSLTEGDSATLVAVMSPVGVGTLFWASIDTSVATVSSTGVVRTKRDGNARIRAVAGPKEDTVVIAVRQRVASIRVTPDSLRSNSLGDTLVFTAAVLDPRNNPISGAAVNWSSAQPGIAESLGGGRFLARTRGTANITASSATVATISATARAVVAQRTASVTIQPSSVLLGAVGEQAQLTASAFDARGNAVPGMTFTWRSAIPALMSVDATGLVTALGTGDVGVTATSSDGVSGTLTVIIERVPASISIQPTSLHFAAIGDTARVSARVLDRAGVEIVGQRVVWSASGSVVVDASGLVRATAAGAGLVTAQNGTITGSISASVAQEIARLEVEPLAPTLRSLGETTTFTARGFDRNGNPAPVQPVWSSSNGGVATIGETTGIAAAVANGTTTITARAGSAQATTTLTVAQAVARVVASPDSVLLNGPGGTGRFTASALDARGSVVAGTAFTWTSLDPTIAQVDGTGAVTGVVPGTARIVASAGAFADTVRAIVGRTTVKISPDSLVFTATGDTTRLTAVVRNAVGAVITVPVTWTSRSTFIALVTDAGLVTGFAPGTTWIVATGGGATDSIRIRVAPQAARVVLSPAVDTMMVGEFQPFVASAYDSRDHAVIIPAYEWTSSDTTIATVDAEGTVTARKAGSVVISAKTGNVVGSASLLVRGTPDLALVQLSVTPADSAMVGDTIVLTVSVKNVGTDAAPATQLHLRLANGVTGASVGDTVVSVRALAPGESDQATKRIFLNPLFPWPPTARLQATVDPANTVAEISETNNSGQTPTVVIRTGSAPPPPTGLPAELVFAIGDSAQITTSVPSPIYSLYGYGLSVSSTGRVTSYATGAFAVIARDSAFTRADTITIWVVPRGYTRAWVPSAADPRFNNAANWLPSGVPSAADVLFIPDCYTYQLATCAPPVLQADATVASIVTGYSYYGGYVGAARMARPTFSFAQQQPATRQFGAGLEGESLQRYLQRRSSRDSAFSAHHGRAAGRMLASRAQKGVREPLPLPSPNASASLLSASSASSSPYEYTADLNGYILTLSGSIPQYASFGSTDTTRVGALRLAGVGQQLPDLAVYDDLLITGTNANVGSNYSAYVGRDLKISGSATVKADINRNLDVTGTLNVPNWIEINGGATFTNAQVLVDDGDLYVNDDVVINGGTLNLDPTGGGGYADFYNHVTITNATINIGDGGFYADSTVVISNSTVPIDWGDFEVAGSVLATNTTIPIVDGWVEVDGDLTMDGGMIGGTGEIWPSIYVGNEVWSDSAEAWINRGSLTLRNGASFGLGDDGWAEVYGDFRVESGSILSMGIDADMDVYSDAFIDGASTAGTLLGGELYFYGNLSVGNSSSPTAYAPSRDHWSEFGYSSAPRTHHVTLANASPTGNHFGSLYSYSYGDTVVFHQPVYATGDLDNGSIMTTDSVHVLGTVWNSGQVRALAAVLDSSFYSSGSGSWQVGHTTIRGGSGSQINASVDGNVRITAAPNSWSLTVNGNVEVVGTGAQWVTGGGGHNVSGSVFVHGGAEFALGNGDMQIGGTLRTEDTGFLTLSSPHKLIVGNAEFTGAANVLDEGILQVNGNLTAIPGVFNGAGTFELQLTRSDSVHQQLALGGGVVPAVRFLGTSPVQLLGDVVTGFFESNSTTQSIGGDAIHHIIADDASVANVHFMNTWLGVGSASATALYLQGLQFRFGSGLSVPQQLRLTLPAGAMINRDGFDFDSLIGGVLVSLNQEASDPTDVTINLTTASVGGNATRPSVARFGGNGTIMWNGSQAFPGPAPSLIGPADRSEYHHFPRDLAFAWHPFAGSVRYEFQSGYANGCASPSWWVCSDWTDLSIVGTPDTTFAGSHMGDQPGRWRVRAVFADSTRGYWTPYRYFNFTTYMSISPDSASLAVSHTSQVQLTAVAPVTTVTWESSNPAVATVSSSGVVTAVAPGVVTIRAVSTGDPTIYATTTITVVPLPTAPGP